VEFYDAADYRNIPSGAHACVYADGLYAAPPAQTVRFRATRWITVLGGTEAAKYAGILDYELGNRAFAGDELREWVAARKAMKCRARVYCDRANMPAVREKLDGLEYLVWVATLDGDKLSKDWTPGLWAVQYAGGMTARVDTSVLYGTW
jgi:hypothetical protein